MEIQSVIQNIRDLTKKTMTNGCTEAEAMSAARKIGDLMKVYNLTMDRVFLGESKCITGVIETGKKRRHPIDGCVVSIAEFCDCRIWCSHSGTGGWSPTGRWSSDKDYKIFGLESDVDMAKYLYSIVWDAMETATAEYKASDAYLAGKDLYGWGVSRKRLSVSFQRGMARRISQRLQEMMENRHREEDDESPLLESTGTSLVVVKRKKVEDEFESLGVILTKAAHVDHKIDHKSYNAGSNAGDKVNLNRPLAGKVMGYLK